MIHTFLWMRKEKIGSYDHRRMHRRERCPQRSAGQWMAQMQFFVVFICRYIASQFDIFAKWQIRYTTIRYDINTLSHRRIRHGQGL